MLKCNEKKSDKKRTLCEKRMGYSIWFQRQFNSRLIFVYDDDTYWKLDVNLISASSFFLKLIRFLL